MSDVLGVGTAVSGAAQAAGSVAAATIAASAANRAADQVQQRWAQTHTDLQPYNDAGQSVLGDLTALARSGPYGGGVNYLAQAAANQPGQMTQAELEATPGYQFNLSQGLQATQSNAAARGLGVSGAALKGAAKYATGLADSTYQNQFNNAQTRFQNLLNLNTGQQGTLTNQYSRLSGIGTLGENAAVQSGVQGNAAANAAAGYLSQAGQASAAGISGAGNALAGSYQNYLSNNQLQQMIDQNNGGTGGYKVNYNDSGFDSGGSGGGWG